MLSNRLAFAALGVACIGAAAGGGYLATRQNTIPTPASAEAQMTAPATSRPVPEAARPVQETEGVVGDATSRPAPAATAQKAATTTSKRAQAQATVARDEHAKAAGHEQPQTLTSTWPSSAASQPPVAPPVPPATTDTAPPAPRADDRVAQEPPRAPEPPQKTFEELVIPADSVIGLQTENRLSSETARVEDRVEARVTRDVKVGDRVAIPAGARALGSVTQVERGRQVQGARTARHPVQHARAGRRHARADQHGHHRQGR